MGSGKSGMMMLIRGQEVAVTPLLGKRYQLELFVAGIPGGLNSFGEVMLEVLEEKDGGEEDGDEDDGTGPERGSPDGDGTNGDYSNGDGSDDI